MREEDLAELYIKNIKGTDFSSESKNKAANLEALQAKLPIINQEREIYMKENKRRFRKPIAIAACIAVILSMSAVVFGQDIVNYFRTITLGEHVAFVSGPELTDEEIAARQEETQAMIDAGELVVVTQDNWVDPDWLTFTDTEEGRSHFFYANVMLPTYAPYDFEFDHIFYFVETLEDLQEYGANYYMSVVFSNGINEIRMQIRYMTEDTGFVAGASPDMREVEINGHPAVVSDSSVDLLVGDVLYMFFGMGNVDGEALIRMAESLN